MRRLFVYLMLLLQAGSSMLLAQSKQPVTSAEQLPRRTIALTGKVSDIYQNDALLKQLAEQINKNLQADLNTYDIRDKATLQNYYSALSMLEFQAGRYAQASTYLNRLADLEDKPEEKATTGLFTYAYAEAIQQTRTSSGDAFKQSFSQAYTAQIKGIPTQFRKKFIEQTKASLTMLNPEAGLAALATQVQPFIDNGKGQVPESIPLALITNKVYTETRVALKETMLNVLNSFKEESASGETAASLWQERSVAIKSSASGKAVKVAVWDTGIDTQLFKGNLFVNTKEKAGNGKDDDNNGYTDDVHGIAYDMKAQRTSGDLHQERKPVHAVAQLQQWAKGAMDMQSGISSQEATALQQKAAVLKPEEAVPFQEDLAWYSVYSHGTHVAGIVAEGNPFVQLMNARLSYSTSVKPDCPTEESQAAQAAMYGEVVAYFKKNGVKVVNMSWRYNAAGYEALLAMYGVGKDEQERKAIAQKWFAREKQALQQAMQQAPEILFVCASGNENNDANFQEYIPASIDLPNVLTVGAVDQEGKRTTFTTEGKSVDLYANGYEVESVVPGGDKIRFSGTSMASPQVANTAAKMLALNPQLTPQTLPSILLETATVSPESEAIRLLHPKKAVEKALQLRKDYTAGQLQQFLAKSDQ